MSNTKKPTEKPAPSTVEPPACSWAAVASMMAQGDDSGFDWDAWKDQMKETACRESCRIAGGWAADKHDRLTLLRAETLPVVVCDECGKANRHHHSCSKYDESKRNDVLR